jgi:hypothetical protein
MKDKKSDKPVRRETITEATSKLSMFVTPLRSYEVILAELRAKEDDKCEG